MFRSYKNFKQINLLTEEYLNNSKNTRVLGFSLLVIIICMILYYNLSLYYCLVNKEKELEELKKRTGTGNLYNKSIADLALLEGLIEKKEKQISVWSEGEAWSSILFRVRSVLPSGCYLKEIKKIEEGVYLKGYTQSYPDLALFLAALEELDLFTRVDVINASRDFATRKIYYELRSYKSGDVKF